MAKTRRTKTFERKLFFIAKENSLLIKIPPTRVLKFVSLKGVMTGQKVKELF